MSTGDPQRQVWATQTLQPRRKATATRTASSASLRPQLEIGNLGSEDSKGLT